jgi:hypothetical protein
VDPGVWLFYSLLDMGAPAEGCGLMHRASERSPWLFIFIIWFMLMFFSDLSSVARKKSCKFYNFQKFDCLTEYSLSIKNFIAEAEKSEKH